MNVTQNNVSAKTGKSSFVYRLIAALTAIACVAAFFLPYTIFVNSATGLTTTELKLYELFEHISDAPYKYLSFIPMFTNPKSLLGLAGGLIPYVLAIALVIAFIFAVLGLILGKKSPLAISIIVYTWGAALYMIAIVSITCYLPLKITFDVNSIILASIGTLAYFAFMCAKLGKKLSLLNSARFLLSLAFTVCLLLALTFDYNLIRQLLTYKEFYRIALIIAIALTLANAILASIRASAQKAFAFDFVNASLELLVSIALILLSVLSPVTDSALLILSGIAVALATVLLILSFVGVQSAKRKNKIAEANRTIEKEENIASPAPVCESTPVETPAPACDAEEDFFAGKQIDTFIATLSVSERNQFANLYLLKDGNVMPEIPSYQIGGDNKNFFAMVFITLGEYRDEIPDGLLSKMYDQMCLEYPQTDFPEL